MKRTESTRNTRDIESESQSEIEIESQSESESPSESEKDCFCVHSAQNNKYTPSKYFV